MFKLNIREYKQLVDTLSLCAKYYNPDTFQHCLRVAKYAIENVCLSEEERQIAFCVAMCHDLLEDTDATIDEICKVTDSSKEFVKNVLTALTKEKPETYVDYIKRLKKCKSIYPYIIKLSDMKDHLMQVETLTDKLKEKYQEALPYLL